MIGGFMAVGTPERIIDEIVRQGKRDLTVIANDTAMPGKGISKLIQAKRLRKVIVSHIGLNPEAQRQMMEGELEVELVPQGTLIERIRCGGHGLGGILTQTGLGTPVEKGKQRIDVDGKTYLLEIALRCGPSRAWPWNGPANPPPWTQVRLDRPDKIGPPRPCA
jgi:acetate CoA/acetoacetate CoA-transferase alpha subunit